MDKAANFGKINFFRHIRGAGRTQKASPECQEAFKAHQQGQADLVQQFKQLQKDRDQALDHVIAGYQGNGAIFRGGDHQAEVTRLLEQRCMGQGQQKGGQTQAPSSQ